MVKTRKRNYGYTGFARTVGTAARLAYRGYRAYSSYKKARTSSNGVTNQYDRSVQYKKKYLSPKKRRRYVRKVRSFRNMLMRELGTRQVIRNETISATAAPAVQQYITFNVYGMNGTNTAIETGCNDLGQIRTNDSIISDNAKVKFTNAVLDCTCRNNGDDDVEVDVYEVKYQTKNRIYPNFGTIQAQAESDTPTIGAMAAMTLNTRGTTLFEFPQTCVNVKVLKKTKYLLGVGNSFTYQKKDRRNHYINGDQMGVTGIANQESFVRSGWTHGVIFLFKAIAGSVSNASISVGGTRSYRYKILENNLNVDGVV